MKHHRITVQTIERKIFNVRDHRVMLDSHLAELYEVETRILVRNMKRNLERFPADFMFQLTTVEFENLRSQIGMSSFSYGGRRHRPYVFTENGVAMLSSVLGSKRAIQVNVQIMRTFTRLRGFHLSYEKIRKEIRSMRRKYDENFAVVFNAIGRLLDGPKRRFRVKGFDK